MIFFLDFSEEIVEISYTIISTTLYIFILILVSDSMFLLTLLMKALCNTRIHIATIVYNALIMFVARQL